MQQKNLYFTLFQVQKECNLSQKCGNDSNKDTFTAFKRLVNKAVSKENN